MATSDILESLIEKDNGYLITSKAVELGVSKPSVSKYVREHDMEKVAHGISKRKTKKFVMQTQRFLIWGSVKSRQAAVIWLKYMTRKDVFVI
nr:type IV toxin-antitoxin system AbiEi family antitoxin domain-containing protein [uncultured Mediterraneibacter sp.]